MIKSGLASKISTLRPVLERARGRVSEIAHRARETAAPVPPQSHLREALVVISGLLGRPALADHVFAGLPVENEMISLGTFQRACERAGLKTALVRRALTEINPSVLPCILLTKSGRAVILRRIDGETLELVHPASPVRLERVTLAVMTSDYAGMAVLVTPDTHAATDVLGGHGPRTELQNHWFWGTIREFWRSYVHVAVAALVVNLLALATPLFTMNVYDRVVPNSSFTTLWSLAVGIALVLGFDFLLKTVRAEVVDVIGKKADILLASRIFEHMLSLMLARRPGSAGSLASQIREFETVREFFTSTTVISIVDLCFILIFVSVLFAVAGPLGWVAVGAIVLCALIAWLVQAPLERAVMSAQKESALRHSILVEALTSLETVKTLGAEGRMQAHWERALLATARSGTAARHWSSLALHLTSLVQQFVTIVMIVWGVYLIGEGAMTTGALVASTILAGRAIAPLAGVSATLMRIQQTRVALKGIDALMQLESERPHGRSFVARPSLGGALAFQNVTLVYPASNLPALRDISFSVRPGERIGIIGRIGCGKTSLGRLVTGLYPPTEGTILVDGVDIRQYHPADLRRGVGLVGQDPELFMGTLRDNIAFGKPEASDEDVLEAARLAGVDAFAALHPLGYDMPIGERGRTLSGGQRQAVAIARTLIRKPQILFLDEPSSAMDASSEAALLTRLKFIGEQGITLLISTHRHSLLGAINRLIVLDQGRIVADGPKDLVLARLRDMAADREQKAAV